MSSAAIMRYLARDVFANKAIVIVPECYWTGDECDLLVVCQDLRLIDVEIKVSRSDFKRDAAKSKWFQWKPYVLDPATRRYQPQAESRAKREWPSQVWKHYFAVPQAMYKPDLVDLLPSSKSGILVFKSELDDHGILRESVTVAKRAIANREAKKISAESAVDIARLANIRMWDALANTEHARRAEAQA